MSAPVANKFQDHYELLGVETNAELSAIQAAHSELSQRFDPGNAKTGDAEKWEAVQIAYEVLSDPSLRKDFDKQKGVGEDSSAPKFSGLDFFEVFGREAGLRMALLCILYDRRRSKPFTPGMSNRHVEAILTATSEQLVSVLWYLKQKGLVTSDDKSNLLITVEGMDYLEANSPNAETVMPWIKPSGAAAPKESAAPPPAAVHAVNAAENDARRSAVDRILSRRTN